MTRVRSFLLFYFLCLCLGCRLADNIGSPKGEKNSDDMCVRLTVTRVRSFLLFYFLCLCLGCRLADSKCVCVFLL